jgi:hypothetical protein
MPRGNQIILLLILIVIIGGVGSYVYLSRGKKEALPAAFALPESSVAAWQGKKAKEQYAKLSASPLFRFLLEGKDVRSFDQDFKYYDSLLAGSSAIQKEMAVHPLLVSLHVVSATDFQLLFLQQTDGDLDEMDMQEFIKEKLPNARVLDHTFNNIKIFDVKDAKKETMFSFCFMQGILALSHSSLLVEDAISAFGNNKSRNTAMMKKISEQMEGDRFYINYTQLPQLLNTWLAPAYRDQAASFSDMGAFGAYEMKTENDRIGLHGTLEPEAANASIWSPLIGQQPQRLGMQAVLPNTTGLFMAWGVSSFKQYHDNYKEFLKNKGRSDAYDAAAAKLQSDQQMNLEQELLPWMGSSWGYALMEPASEESDPQMLMLIKPADTSSAIASLAAINAKIENADQAGTLPTVHRNHKIERVAFKGAFSLLLGDVFNAFEQPYYTRLGEYIVFGNTVDAVKNCINSYMDKQTLDLLPAYKALTPSLKSASSFSFYVSPARMMMQGTGFVRDTYKDHYRENYSVYKGLAGLVFQLSAEGNAFNNDITLMQSSVKQANAEQVWSMNLDADAATRPFMVLNPETRLKEILIQDKSDNLYLISSAGKILWKKNLGAAIQGEVYQIDLFKNEQLEYLFATTDQIYLIDHDGNFAGNYPIRLGTPTTTGLALFDFRGDKEYSYFVGDDKNRIYGFSGNGRPLPGWAPHQVDARLSMPLKYFALTDKPYLFGVTDRGSLYVWDEGGRIAAKPIATSSRFRNPFRLNFGATIPQCSVFSVDTSGTLYTVSFDGMISKRTYGRFRNSPFFEYFDTDGNGKSEYILAADQLIASYEKDTIMNWKMITSEKLAYPPQKVSFGLQTYIGYTSKAAGKVYLFSRAGTPFPGFPQQGNTMFTVDDMNGNQDLEMAVGGENKMLYLYRLNR